MVYMFNVLCRWTGANCVPYPRMSRGFSSAVTPVPPLSLNKSNYYPREREQYT